jgi:hypothetical protein
VEINDVIVRNVSCSSVPGTCVGVRPYTARVTVKSHGTGGILIMSFGSPYISNYVALSYLRIRPVAGTATQVVSQMTCGRPVPASPCLGQTSPPAPTQPNGQTFPPTTTTPRFSTQGGPGTSAPNGTSACSLAAATNIPAGFVVSNMILATNFATFNCSKFLIDLAVDMGLLPQQILVYSVSQGSGTVLFKFSVALAFLGPYESKLQQGSASAALNIQSMTRDGSSVVITVREF